MNRMLVGALGALMLAAVGLFYWQGRAIEAPGMPPPEASEGPRAEAQSPEALPSADVAGMEGPALPEAAGMTNEQKRFARYDRNRDLSITRDEMLSTRTAAFRRLDVDGNNLLTFEEWAVTTVQRFDGADADGNRRLTPAEFATTAPKPRKRKTARCAC